MPYLAFVLLILGGSGLDFLSDMLLVGDPQNQRGWDMTATFLIIAGLIGLAILLVKEFR